MPTEIQYGVEAGGRKGPSAGVENTAITRWREEGGGERWRMPRPPTGDGFKWFLCSVSSFHSSSLPFISLSVCCHCFCPFSSSISVFPDWCSAHWSSADIGKWSPLDPAAERKQGFEPDPVCVCVCVRTQRCVGRSAPSTPPLHYRTISLYHSPVHIRDFWDS